MFASCPKPMRLQALLEFSRQVPALPERYANNRELLEQVHECQSPFFLAHEINDGVVELFFEAPPEAPTVRGFAGILQEGFKGCSPQDILDTPDAFYFDMGLNELITPMRLRGMGAILFRLKHQLRNNA